MADSLKSVKNPTVHARTVVNPDGTDVMGKYSGFGISEYDYAGLTEAATTDTWVFKTGGASGSTVATVTITYTDSGKGTISKVEKS